MNDISHLHATVVPSMNDMYKNKKKRIGPYFALQRHRVSGSWRVKVPLYLIGMPSFTNKTNVNLQAIIVTIEKNMYKQMILKFSNSAQNRRTYFCQQIMSENFTADFQRHKKCLSR
jgi:hypothetical protein